MLLVGDLLLLGGQLFLKEIYCWERGLLLMTARESINAGCAEIC